MKFQNLLIHIIGLNIFDEEELRIEFLGIKQIMALQKKITSQREIVINMSKTPILNCSII